MALKSMPGRLLKIPPGVLGQLLAALMLAGALGSAVLAPAQGRGFELTPLDRKHLLMIAREAAEAHLDGRPRRRPRPNPRLERRQGLAVSYYANDGRLLRRAWRLAQPWAMTEAAAELSVEAGFASNGAQPPLGPGEARASRIRVSVISDYVRITEAEEIGPQDAVVILWGFKEGLALPGDAAAAPHGLNMLEAAGLSIGLNAPAWRLDGAVLFKARPHEITEAPGGPEPFYHPRRQ